MPCVRRTHRRRMRRPPPLTSRHARRGRTSGRVVAARRAWQQDATGLKTAPPQPSGHCGAAHQPRQQSAAASAEAARHFAMARASRRPRDVEPRRRKPPFLTVLAWTAALAPGALAQEPVARITTMLGLRTAIAYGAQHIELNAHMDFRNAAPGEPTVFLSPAFRSFRVCYLCLARVLFHVCVGCARCAFRCETIGLQLVLRCGYRATARAWRGHTSRRTTTARRPRSARFC